MTQSNDNSDDTFNHQPRTRKLVIDLKPEPEQKKQQDNVGSMTEYSLEMKPVLEAVTRYAQRTHAIGALRGARALELLAVKLDKITPSKESLEKLSKEIRLEAEHLRSFIQTSS